MFWIVLVAFVIPSIVLIAQLVDERKERQQKLDRIQKRLRELEESGDDK